MTAHANMSGDRERCLLQAWTEYIAKPVQQKSNC